VLRASCGNPKGDTKEKALKNIKEAIEGYLEVKAELLERN